VSEVGWCDALVVLAFDVYSQCFDVDATCCDRPDFRWTVPCQVSSILLQHCISSHLWLLACLRPVSRLETRRPCRASSPSSSPHSSSTRPRSRCSCPTSDPVHSASATTTRPSLPCTSTRPLCATASQTLPKSRPRPRPRPPCPSKPDAPTKAAPRPSTCPTSPYPVTASTTCTAPLREARVPRPRSKRA
jgi:hypothetical protein